MCDEVVYLYVVGTCVMCGVVWCMYVVWTCVCDDGIHLYSCIEKWLKKAQPLGKCPQCNLKARRKDIRVIYAKSVSVVDTTERDRALKVNKKGKPVGACVCVCVYAHIYACRLCNVTCTCTCACV